MLWILCAERRILAAKEDDFIGLAGTDIDKPGDEVKFLCLWMFQTIVGPVFPVEEKSAL